MSQPEFKLQRDLSATISHTRLVVAIGRAPTTRIQPDEAACVREPVLTWRSTDASPSHHVAITPQPRLCEDGHAASRPFVLHATRCPRLTQRAAKSPVRFSARELTASS